MPGFSARDERKSNRPAAAEVLKKICPQNHVEFGSHRQVPTVPIK
jgi:hypothetical protein